MMDKKNDGKPNCIGNINNVQISSLLELEHHVATIYIYQRNSNIDQNS